MTTPSHDAPTVLLGTVRTPPPRPAHVLGRYRVGTVLGRGGMSIVYRGEDTHTGRPVAIKVLAPHLAADPQYRRRLLAEARAVARLPHPHIVQILDVGEALTSSETASAPSPSAGRGGARPHAQNPRLLPGEKAGGGMRGRDEEGEGAVVLVMELVSGEGLDARIGRGPLPVGDVVAIGAQVADALAFAHRRGVVHRDVKPHNILLADSLWVKLTDFGIARTLDAATTLTAPGLILGSAPYIAPEVLEGRAVDARADVYALG
ncbi:MAG TPA: serine/threonine-protein kinase, partial [Chloroflexota bacterium]|nr:serine/threonine-protein kinase [Chloroflexota bacterium]